MFHDFDAIITSYFFWSFVAANTQFPSEQLPTVTSPCPCFIGGCKRSKSCVSTSFNLQKLICYSPNITYSHNLESKPWIYLRCPKQAIRFGNGSLFFGLQYLNPPSWCLLLVVTELIVVPKSFSRIVLFLLAIFDNVPIFLRCWDSHPFSVQFCSVDYTNLSCFHQLLGGFSIATYFSVASFKLYSSSRCLTAQFSLISRHFKHIRTTKCGKNFEPLFTFSLFNKAGGITRD